MPVSDEIENFLESHPEYFYSVYSSSGLYSFHLADKYRRHMTYMLYIRVYTGRINFVDYWISKGSGRSDENITFERFFEEVPADIKRLIIFNLDLFK